MSKLVKYTSACVDLCLVVCCLKGPQVQGPGLNITRDHSMSTAGVTLVLSAISWSLTTEGAVIVQVYVLSSLVQREGIDVEVLFDMVRQEELASSEVNEDAEGPLSDLPQAPHLEPAESLSSDAPGPAAEVPFALPSSTESVAADLPSEPSFDSWTAAESLSWDPSTAPGHAEEVPQALSPCPMQPTAFSFATNVSPSTAEMVPNSSLSLEDITGTELPAELAVGGIVGEMSAPFVIPFTGSSHAEDELPLPMSLPFTGADSDDFNLDELL